MKPKFADFVRIIYGGEDYKMNNSSSNNYESEIKKLH